MYQGAMYNPLIGAPAVQPTPAIPAMAAFQPRTDLLSVSGLAGAKAYQTAPDSRYALFDTEDEYVYVKQTDSNNMATYRKFKLIEEPFEEPNAIQNGVQYVTKKEFDEFKEEILNAQQFIQESAGATIEPGNSKRANKSNGSNKQCDANG